MSDEIVQLAKRSPVAKSAGDWLGEINKRALAPTFKKSDESSASAFARYVTKTEDGKILHSAHNQQRLFELRNGRPAVAKSGGEDVLERLKKLVRERKLANSDEGLVDDSDSPSDRPAEQLDKLVDAHMKANRCTRSKAYDAVMRTDAGKKLLAADKARRKAG